MKIDYLINQPSNDYNYSIQWNVSPYVYVYPVNENLNDLKEARELINKIKSKL